MKGFALIAAAAGVASGVIVLAGQQPKRFHIHVSIVEMRPMHETTRDSELGQFLQQPYRNRQFSLLPA